MTDSTYEQIKLYLAYNDGSGQGFYYRTIAKLVFGRAPTQAQINSVGRVARREGYSSRDWKMGISTDARLYLAGMKSMNKRVGKIRRELVFA